uniref:Hypothetical chloroplast RF20 n=1 Tax=Hazenia capsulata TaxID=2202518 RepID=A0A1W6EHK9_9CHLO|nr:hypothetical chloroplast RF20 [Hazenia capsulata]ARK14889.1 hypothetical chloroplast RF20 [Hazenia capsulata]
MNSATKFFRYINKINVQIKKKIWVFQKNILLSVFSLFFGFIFGNLFGTFLNYFRHFINWDGLIITLTIFIVELINYLNYQKKKQKNCLIPFYISKNYFFQTFFIWVLKKGKIWSRNQRNFFFTTYQKIKKKVMTHRQKLFVPPKNTGTNKKKSTPFLFKVKLSSFNGNTQKSKNFFVFVPVPQLLFLTSLGRKKIKNTKTLRQNKLQLLNVTTQFKAWAQKSFLTFSTKFSQQNKNKFRFFFPYFFIETRDIPKFFKKPTKKKVTIDFIKLLNFYKIGLLLGFFIDAFKVGS